VVSEGLVELGYELTWGAWHMVFHIPCTLQQDYIVSAPLLPSLKIWLVGWLVGV
jgi:hypothetical protein